MKKACKEVRQVRVVRQDTQVSHSLKTKIKFFCRLWTIKTSKTVKTCKASKSIKSQVRQLR